MWEFRYYGFILELTPPADADGDGFSDVKEALFGTNPLSTNSFPFVNSPTISGGNAVFSWPSIAGIRYQSQTTLGLNSPWSSFGGARNGSGALMQETIPSPLGGQLFFRIEASVPRADVDGDGLDAFEESLLGSSDSLINSDTDAATDVEEFYLQTMGVAANPATEFTIPGIRDGEGDADNDGVPDLIELRAGTNAGDPKSFPASYPTLDSDSDGLSDAWEIANFGNVALYDGNGNPDGDLLTNRQEYLLDLNPNQATTISTYPDGQGDQDGDNVIDVWELEDGTDPKNAASVDLVKNFVILQGVMEHKNSWGAVVDPAGQFAGTTMKAQAIGFENAQLSSTNRVYGVLNEVAAPFTSSGSGYTATKYMRFRKGVNYQITLSTTNNNLPFISGKYLWTTVGNSDELTYKAFGYVVTNRQGYVPNASGIPGAADTTATPNVDVNNTHFTLKSAGQGSPDATMYPAGTLSMPALDIIEVASDQIAGNLANKLPHPYYIGEPNNPMLMAQNSIGVGAIAVKLTTLPALRSRLYVGIRRVGQTTIDGQKIVSSNDTSALSFVVASGRPIYEIVGGVDLDNNGTLDPAEAVVVFGKTPFRDKGGGTSGPDGSQQKKVLPYAQHGSAAFHDKIIVIGGGEFAASKSFLLRRNLLGTDYAGDVLSNFVHGTTTVPTATLTPNVPISSTQPGLSHPLGARWNATLQDTTYRFTFADGTEASNDFEASTAVGKIIDQVAKAHLADMLAIGGATPMVAPAYAFTSEQDLLFTEDEKKFGVPFGINELGNTFGKVTITGFVSLMFTKVNPTTIHVTDALFAGSFDDLYDFAWGGGELGRAGSVVQSGHASIAVAPEANSGKVFFTRLEFNGKRTIGKNYP